MTKRNTKQRHRRKNRNMAAAGWRKPEAGGTVETSTEANAKRAALLFNREVKRDFVTMSGYLPKHPREV